MIQDLMENVKLTPQEQNIVSYIEQHPKEVMKLNAKELSEKIFVSPPTMNRFIKKLGFNISSTPNDMLIILNDNDMSIERAVGGMEKYILKLDTKEKYHLLR